MCTAVDYVYTYSDIPKEREIKKQKQQRNRIVESRNSIVKWPFSVSMVPMKAGG